MSIHRSIPILLLLLALPALTSAQDGGGDSPPTASSQQQADAAQNAQDSADQAQSTADSTAKEVEDLKAEVEKLKKELAKAEKDNAQQVNQMETLLQALNNRVQQLESRAPGDSSAVAAVDSGTVEKEPVPIRAESPDTVHADNTFPGSITIPGSEVAFKFGGQIRLSMVRNLDALGVDDRFLTEAIPASGTPDAAKGPRVSLSANATRFNFDLRTPTEYGKLRAFIEGDFAGSGNTFRLRHAFGQYRRSLAGQTWTTFTDPRSSPTDIDFEGINSRINTRQAQVRITVSFWENWTTSASVESPQPEVTNAQGVSQVPDFVLAALYERDSWHMQAATVFRQIRAQPQAGIEDIKSKPGWGISLSGKVAFPVLGEDDHILFQAVDGLGLGRYINDLQSLGGQDAIFDTTTQVLQVLPSRGVYFAYEHQWTNQWSSTATWGIVKVDNLNSQSPGAYRRTDRSSINIIFAPVRFVSVGFEFLHGARHNFDGSYGKANQWQLAATYIF